VSALSLEEVVRRIVREEIAAAKFADAPEWLTAAEAAEYLGIALGTLHNLVTNGGLPRHGPKGTKLRFRRVELDGYVAGRRRA
jgi:excisionase family DNA binding protein